MVCIDWEKAFDKVHPGAIHAVLERYGVPPHFLRVLGSLLASPQFRVDMDGSISDWHAQSSGIRQGCTLSP
eukprot:4576740-Alexandrium_andersonii.AAC.1